MHGVPTAGRSAPGRPRSHDETPRQPRPRRQAPGRRAPARAVRWQQLALDAPHTSASNQRCPAARWCGAHGPATSSRQSVSGLLACLHDAPEDHALVSSTGAVRLERRTGRSRIRALRSRQASRQRGAPLPRMRRKDAAVAGDRRCARRAAARGRSYRTRRIHAERSCGRLVRRRRSIRWR